MVRSGVCAHSRGRPLALRVVREQVADDRRRHFAPTIRSFRAGRVFRVSRRQVPGTAFCAFFFFEQFLPVATYMADSRSQSLTYVTVGDPDLAEHDWAYLFSHAGVLEHDIQIGAWRARVLGWIGMLAIVGWLVWRAWPWRNADSA